MAQACLSETGRDYLARRPGPQRLAMFFRCWTRRKGVLKAYGVGPAAKLSRLEANPQRVGTVEVRHRWGTSPARGLCRIYLAARTGAGPSPGPPGQARPVRYRIFCSP